MTKIIIAKKTLIFLSILIPSVLFAQGEFITRWNFATAGSGATQLSFGTETSGTLNYYWQEVSPGTATGSGSFSGTTLTINGLPSGATIRLGIYPTNFQRVSINESQDKIRLLGVEQWGSTVWTSMATAFYGCINLNITATDIPVLNSCTSIQSMFQNCRTLNGLTNINFWHTAAVTNLVVTPINTGGMIRLSKTTSIVCTSVRPSPAMSKITLMISSGLANYTASERKLI
jgi:hypothetical protein